MDLPFIIISFVILLTAAGAVGLHKDIHCGLCAALSFLAMGVLYLKLDAIFLGWVQLMVYVGAIAVLVLFTVLLTRPQPEAGEPPPVKRFNFWQGSAVAGAVAASLAVCITAYQQPGQPAEHAQVSIEALGFALMERHIVAMEVVGLLLTAALVGAVVLAAPEGGHGHKR
jgi:NADH-quinone oxidoreductase subunit J